LRIEGKEEERGRDEERMVQEAEKGVDCDAGSD